jgi:hypothetical protein
MGKVFISYAREDKESAHEVCRRLTELGFDPWIDVNDLEANDDITTVIDNQISQVDAVLVLWSGAAKASTWVRGEALSGFAADKYIGALLEATVPPTPFMRLNAPDLSDWNLLHDHRGWQTLVRGLAEMVKTGGAARLDALEKALARERAAVDAELQAQLPLAGDEASQEKPDEPPPVEEHAYSDVDGLVERAQQVLAGASKFDLDAAIIQAAMDQEMLRDAAYVVGGDRSKIAKPKGSNYKVCASVAEARERAADGVLIVVTPGTYEENLRVRKNVRIVGLGRVDERPTLTSKANEPVVAIDGSARVENLNLKARNRNAHVLHLISGQPVLLRCDITSFIERTGGQTSVWVAGRANPIMMATSVASNGCDGIHFVAGSGGTLIGVDIYAKRGVAVSCQGRPQLRGCRIEAVGGHAVEVRNRGYPLFEDCSIEGRGATVVKVVDGRPRMSDSRVKAIRQLAFDFEGDNAGRFERNIVDSNLDANAGTAPASKGFGFTFWRSKSKDAARATNAQRHESIMRLRSVKRPIFVANKTADGNDLQLPSLS